MADKTRSVGVLITTIIDGKRVAVLQVRGSFNPEKMKPESWIGLCQVTAAGKLKDGERYLDGVLRETSEELGDFVAGIIRGMEKDGGAFRGDLSTERLPQPIAETSDAARKTYHFFLHDPSFLKWVRLGPSSGGLILVDKDREIHTPGDEYGKTSVFNPYEKVTMFGDEAVAVRKALSEHED